MIDFLLLIVGLLILCVAAEIAIRGAVGIAEGFRKSNILKGITKAEIAEFTQRLFSETRVRCTVTTAPRALEFAEHLFEGSLTDALL